MDTEGSTGPSFTAGEGHEFLQVLFGKQHDRYQPRCSRTLEKRQGQIQRPKCSCPRPEGIREWGVLVEILPWPCPLTPAENWLRTRAGLGPYQGGFLLHYLDALVYPDVPPGLLTVGGVAVCLFNLGIYAVRF